MKRFLGDSEGTRDLRARAYKGYARLHRTSIRIQSTRRTIYKQATHHHGKVKNVRE